ncbi:MAG TPA: ATP-binding cassette domain-containing protein [Longimicrobiales bacterium]|nr:ATP-binding cassette domain-containing protein [Longimicrobiales bacterium]
MTTPELHLQEVRRELAREARSPDGGDPRHPVIAISDVWLEFDQPVLRGVDLELAAGETLLVAGQSGTGKSTLLKLILRLLLPDRGSIRVRGVEITTLSYREAQDYRRRIGMVFQNAALFDSMTIYENVAYPLRENTTLREHEIERVVRERLRFVDLDPDRVMPMLPEELSGGMRKRVGIARAIATEPDIVLYDEPTAGLDPIAVATILRLIRKLQRELSVSSIVVTHDIRAGFRVASRVNVLRDGRIVFDGTPEEMAVTDDPYLRAFLA